jgi:hypothetical protein
MDFLYSEKLHFMDKLLAFQNSFTIRKHTYLLSQTGNSNETPVCSDLPPNEIIDYALIKHQVE